MKRFIAALAVCSALPMFGLTITRVESPTTAAGAATLLANALLAPVSGITVTSTSFVGGLGTGDGAQSGTFTGFNLVPSGGGFPTLTLGDGIFLTSGTSNIPLTNTLTNFGRQPGTGGDAEVTALLAARQAVAPAQVPSTTVNDVNSLTITFTANPGITSVGASFVFGSDEFPDQLVTDFFMFIVDGVNYAVFPDGSLISFVSGANAGNFLNNGNGSAGPYGIEYDGLSRVLGVEGLLNPLLTTHTLKIVIGDTADSIFDSGVFLSSLGGSNSTVGGICGGPGQPACSTGGTVPEPSSVVMGLTGLAALGLLRRKRN